MTQLPSCLHSLAPKTVNDCAKSRSQAIPCIRWYLETPVTAAEYYHAEVYNFFFKWIAGASALNLIIDPKVAAPVIETRNEKNNADILLAYLAVTARY